MQNNIVHFGHRYVNCVPLHVFNKQAFGDLGDAVHMDTVVLSLVTISKSL